MEQHLLDFAKHYHNSLHRNVSFDAITAVEEFLVNWLENSKEYRDKNAYLMAMFSEAMSEHTYYNFSGTVYRGLSFKELDGTEKTDYILENTYTQPVISTTDLDFMGDFFAMISSDEYEVDSSQHKYGVVLQLEVERGFDLASFMVNYEGCALSGKTADTFHSYFGENEILVLPKNISKIQEIKSQYFNNSTMQQSFL